MGRFDSLRLRFPVLDLEDKNKYTRRAKGKMFVCWLVGCLTSQQQASVSQGRAKGKRRRRKEEKKERNPSKRIQDCSYCSHTRGGGRGGGGGGEEALVSKSAMTH